jgi:tetraacyldisaccharide 4'-kinase
VNVAWNMAVNVLLKPAEMLYRGINRVRRSLYRKGVLKGKRLPKPVISVGNLAVGGAGKTPAVIAIGRFLIERGWRVAILTRGYGRADEAQGPVTSLDAARFGDEPVLIKKHLEKADVIVGRKRYENGLLTNCDVYLLDDGFQHLQLARDVDIVIDVVGARWYREGPSALRDADVIIPRKLHLSVPTGVRGQKLFAFAGLANNQQFFESLADLGLDLVGTFGFPDHHRYTEGDLEVIRGAARDFQAEAIVTTEKDAVKIAAHDMIPIPAEMVIERETLEQIEARIRP